MEDLHTECREVLLIKVDEFHLQGGIAATISHVDFFSVPSQRLAFQIAANCATYVTANDFAQVRDSLADLTQRLLIEVVITITAFVGFAGIESWNGDFWDCIDFLYAMHKIDSAMRFISRILPSCTLVKNKL